MGKIRKLIYLFTPSELKKAIKIVIMMIIMAILDMAGVASIMPFIAVLSNPDLIETNSFINTIFNISKLYGVETYNQFLFTLGLLVFLLLITSLAFKSITMYMKIRFTEMREYSFSKRLVENYLHQPYSWFLNQNSADLGKSILSEVEIVKGSGIQSMFDLIAQSFVVTAILVLLILINPQLALILGLVLGISYSIIYKLTKKFLNRIGQERIKANQNRFTTISEAFGAVKEVKATGLEQVYINRFSGPAKTYALNVASSQILNQLPRYLLEAIAFGGMLLLTLYLMKEGNNFSSIIPIIALYAFAGYRIMPALQLIYSSISTLRFCGPAIDALYNEMSKLKQISDNKNNNIVKFKKDITLNNIEYKFLNSSKMALQNINLRIPVQSIIGLVGETGSGKTTTVDIILGLLQTQKGTLEVDGVVINKENIKDWQRSIGYVPQHIFLSDDTVAANIAFGTIPENIDQKAVERAAEIANLHKFVIDELPQKYKTIVGERGVRLSGGQRQRIGIARALYHRPKLLILDEATSALDNITENIIMDAIYNLHKKITMIVIAHRLSTVKKCDNIYFLDNGKVLAQGNFTKLLNTNKQFRLMAKNEN